MITLEQDFALKSFARVHGRRWKSQLLAMWASGSDAIQPGGALLRQIRNNFGPRWLKKYRIDDL